MKRAARVLAFAASALTLLAATGCAADEDGAGRGAAYPQAVGYTPPGEAQPPPPAQPPPGQPRPRQAPQPSAPAQEVVVGGDDETDETLAGGANGGGTAALADSASAASPASPASPAPAGGDEYADTDPSALTDFRSTLDPYGAWRDDPTYGTVWVPSSTVVGQDFTPYVSAGHWVYDDDYVRASDYSWGWAPFHYGRWVYGGGVGWEWIPGRRYAGAWVSWRYGWDDWAYVGWAPLPPVWCWHGGYAVGVGYVPYAPYAFVPSAHLFAPAVGTRVIAGAAVGPIASHTQPWVPPTSGRVAARPAVGGPPPSTLRIQSNAVAHATAGSGAAGGLAQARAYARPSTAVALGASTPKTAGFTTARAGFATPSRTPYAASPGPAAGARAPSYALGGSSSSAGSHFGGKLGAGFSGSAAAAPPARPYYGAPSGSPAPGYHSSYGSYAAPAAPGYHAAPSYHSFSGGSGGYAGASGFHGSGGGSTFHAGGGGFSGSHSGGSGGGFHGGGGGGGHFGGGGGGGHGGGHR